jgi:hypothetical protein
MINAFNKAFINNTLKKRREDLLFERERGLMPATQPIVERKIQIRDINSELQHLYAEKQQLQQLIDDLKIKIGYKLDVRYLLERGGNVVEKEKREFVRQCPAADCQGFLSTQWKCGICKVWVCPDCHEVKGLDHAAEHTCKQENLETARLIAKESKPCPNCQARICRISGCASMFCTVCHVFWDWNTGRTIRGHHIHNPHAMEYFARLSNGQVRREHGDIPCGGFPGVYDLRSHMINIKCPQDLMRRVQTRLRDIIHVWDMEAPRYQVNEIDDNVDIRAKYMMKEIDETQFKRFLQQREKARDKKREYYEILTTMRDIAIDIFIRIMRSRNLQQIEKEVQHFDDLCHRTFAFLEEVAAKYSCTAPAALCLKYPQPILMNV